VLAKVFPVLRYDDPAAAIDWLCKAFGFIAQSVNRDARGNVLNAQLRVGPDSIMIGPVRDDDQHGMLSPRCLPAQSQAIYVAVDDVNEHCERAFNAGSVVVIPPFDTPNGAREYSCLDCEDHIWSFGNHWGEPLPAVNAVAGEAGTQHSPVSVVV